MDSEMYVQYSILIDYADSVLATRLSLMEQCCLWCVPCLFGKSA